MPLQFHSEGVVQAPHELVLTTNDESYYSFLLTFDF
jgi:hypothetical protein